MSCPTFQRFPSDSALPRAIDATAGLLDIPFGTGENTLREGSEGLEESARQVDVSGFTAWALVDHLAGLGDAVVLDNDGLSADCIGHEAPGQSEDQLNLAVIGSDARAWVGSSCCSVVVGHFADAGGALATGPIVRGRARTGAGESVRDPVSGNRPRDGGGLLGWLWSRTCS